MSVKKKRCFGKIKNIEIEPENKNIINNLSDDCIAEIFKFLCPLERLQMKIVCRKWRRATELAWSDIKKLTIDYNDVWNLPNIGAIINHCGRFLTELISERFCESILLPLIGKNCHNLTKIELNVSLKCADYYDYQNAFSNMKKLSYIKITDHRFRHQYAYTTRIYTSILHDIPENIKEIHFLSTGSIVRSTDGFLATIRKFNNLQCLTLNNWQLGYPAMLIIALLKTIVNLDLKLCSIEKKGLSLLECLENLEHLNIENVHGIDNESIMTIANTCKKIKYLNINLTHWCIPAESLKKLCKLNKLETLLMNNVDNANDDMFDNINNLRVLDLSDCRQITDAGVIKIIKKCPNLETIDLSRTGITHECILYANEETKKRVNNIVLIITLRNTIATYYQSALEENSIDESPFLFLEMSDEGSEYWDEFNDVAMLDEGQESDYDETYVVPDEAYRQDNLHDDDDGDGEEDDDGNDADIDENIVDNNYDDDDDGDNYIGNEHDYAVGDVYDADIVDDPNDYFDDERDFVPAAVFDQVFDYSSDLFNDNIVDEFNDDNNIGDDEEVLNDDEFTDNDYAQLEADNNEYNLIVNYDINVDDDDYYYYNNSNNGDDNDDDDNDDDDSNYYYF